MLSSKLRHKIDLQQKSATRDSFGSEVATWTTKATVRAAIEPLSGREYFMAYQVQSEVTHKITIRYYGGGITPGWRIKFGTRVFDILSVINIEEKNQTMILMAKEFVT